MLDEIARLALASDIDALVIAGDVFDHQNPSALMYRMLFDFFERLAGHAITTVMIAGNHDSIGRLEAPGGLLRRLGVHAVGALASRDGAVDLDRHLIEIRRQGEAVGAVLAIPYLRPADLPGFLAFDAPAEAGLEAGVRRLYGEALAAARERIGSLPLVATGHLHVKGASLTDPVSERRILIGGEEGIAADAFGDLADYVALGHLHRAQSLGDGQGGKAKSRKASPQRVRYAGSPLPLSSVERDYEHGVSLVELRGREITVEHLPLPRPVPFLRLPEKGRLGLDAVEAALQQLGLAEDLAQGEWPFIQVCLEVEGPQPGLRARIDDLLAGYPVRALAPDIKRPGQPQDERSREPLKRLTELSPEELFARAFEAAHGSLPDADDIGRFRALLEEAAR